MILSHNLTFEMSSKKIIKRKKTNDSAALLPIHRSGKINSEIFEFLLRNEILHLAGIKHFVRLNQINFQFHHMIWSCNKFSYFSNQIVIYEKWTKNIATVQTRFCPDIQFFRMCAKIQYGFSLQYNCDD